MLKTAATALVLVLLLCSCGGSGGKVVKGIYEAEGLVLGQAVLETVQGEGPVLVLLETENVADVTRKISAARVRGLKDAVGGTSLSIKVAEDVASDDFTPMIATYLEVIPDAMLDNCLAQYPDAVAIVSFVGVPSLAWGKAHDQPIPIFVGPGSDPTIAEPLLKHNRIQAYVKPKTGAKATEAPKRGLSPREVFDRHHELITR